MIYAKNFTKHYAGFDLNISLEIPEGRITGLVGKNGAGKSTTIKGILGLIKADGGQVNLLGCDSWMLGPKEKQNIGVSLAESGFSPYLKVADINRILAKCYENHNCNEFLSGCEKAGLPLDKNIKEFSTGMKAKLRVLIAMSHKAKLLILDEPTAGLDVEARGEVLDMIRDYMVEDESRSVLITSHISSDLENICDDIYLIHNGQVILHEDTHVILGNYGLLKVDEETYQRLDKNYLIKARKESYGYACFAREKQYYIDNYPGIAVENGSIDELILMLTGGKN